jgi:Na+/proline symporter
MILFNIPIVAFCFALIGGFYWSKANSQGAYVSILAGIIWGVFCYFYFGEAGNYTWYWAIYGIPLIFISGISASLFCAKKS